MEKLNDNQILIYGEDGMEYLMNILFTYEVKERNAEYVLVYDPAEPDDIYVMRYNEEHELFEVTDESELEEASEILDAYMNDEKIQNIK